MQIESVPFETVNRRVEEVYSKNMEIRKLDNTYRERIIEIFTICFDYKFDIDEDGPFFDDPSLWECVWGAFDGQTLIASYISYKQRVKIRNRAIECRYLDGVATLPEYRNMGIIKDIFMRDCADALDNGINIMMLDPFKHDYYRKLGFETALENLNLSFDYSLLSREMVENDLRIVSGMLFQKDSMKSLVEAALEKLWEESRYAEVKEISAYSQGIYREKDLLCAVALDDDDLPHGLILYSKKERKMNIRRFSFTDLQGFYALKKFLLNHRDQLSSFEIRRVPPDFPVELLLHSGWQAGKFAELKDFSSRMMRILSPVAVISELMNKKIPDRVIIEIEDRNLPQNNLSLSVGNGEVVTSTDRHGFSISISDLVPIVTGRISASRLWRMGKLGKGECGKLSWGITEVPLDVQILDSLFPRITTHNVH